MYCYVFCFPNKCTKWCAKNKKKRNKIWWAKSKTKGIQTNKMSGNTRTKMFFFPFWLFANQKIKKGCLTYEYMVRTRYNLMSYTKINIHRPHTHITGKKCLLKPFFLSIFLRFMCRRFTEHLTWIRKNQFKKVKTSEAYNHLPFPIWNGEKVNIAILLALPFVFFFFYFGASPFSFIFEEPTILKSK